MQKVSLCLLAEEVLIDLDLVMLWHRFWRTSSQQNSKSCVRKILNGYVADMDNVVMRQMEVLSLCAICESSVESVEHLSEIVPLQSIAYGYWLNVYSISS